MSRRFLFNVRYNRKLTREAAKTLTVGSILDEIKDNFWGDREEWESIWVEFQKCWNEIYRLINIDDHTVNKKNILLSLKKK